MTHRTDHALSEPICYVVIDPDRVDPGVQNQQHNLSAECIGGRRISAFHVRYSLAEATLPRGRCGSTFCVGGYAQLRLAIDVVGDLCGYPQRLPHAAVAQWELVALAGPGGPLNRVATELLHRLGANLDIRVYGPLVLHAAPDSRQHINSLSSLQLRGLAEMTSQIGSAIEGGKRTAAPPGRPTVTKENLAPWSRQGHAVHTSNQRSHAATAG